MIISKALDFCIEKAIVERSKNTVRTYRYAAQIFLEYLREKKIDPDREDITNLSPELIVHFPAWLIEHYSRMTAGVYMAGIKYAWNWMLIQDWVQPTVNQSARINKAIETARFNHGARRTRTPGKGDLEKMTEAAKQSPEESPRKERNLALVLFLATSGCRNSEATSLTIKDIDLKECTAFIKNGKGEKDRLAFFSKETSEAMRKYFDARGFSGKADPVFARHDRGAGRKHKFITTATVRNVVEDITKIAGVTGNFTPHYFRHAFAMKALDETGNLALVQDLLGHASPATTRVYAEIREDDLKAAHHRLFE